MWEILTTSCAKQSEKVDECTGGWVNEKPHKRIHASTHQRARRRPLRLSAFQGEYALELLEKTKPISHKIGVSAFATKDYESNWRRSPHENKANQNEYGAAAPAKAAAKKTRTARGHPPIGRTSPKKVTFAYVKVRSSFVIMYGRSSVTK